ncbi:hypothetical protein [Mycobacterium sp. 236(2023)]|uniref:hypothetical protein n=1 Tax=Mycobacterium sp. 236(2023) TaxID=3038163 RepID=UPI0024153D6E|nr:hypothetical protein [Mycobacterium sp. 236(2023)]MDG4666589.1 hypothetical protein [Mycobacterium sp. 236(2023)]
MTDLASDLEAKPDPRPAIAGGAVEVTNTAELTLITEQEVLIGSAAALAGPKVRRNYLAMVRAAFTSGARSGDLVTPKHYPRHHAFIEDALMSRMMDRL